MKAEQQLTGVMLAMTGVLVLSPDALLIRLIDTNTATLLFWRTLLQGVALWAALAFFYRSGLIASVRAIGTIGIKAIFVFACSITFFITSITLTTAANTLFILATAPLFAALISWLFLGERIAVRTWVGIALALTGIGIIFIGSMGGGTLIGDLLAVAAAITLAGQLSIARHARNVNLIPALATAPLLVAIGCAASFAEPLAIDGDDVIWIVVMGLMVVPVAFGLLTLAPRYISSPEVSLIMQLEAILGPLWVWMGVGEVPSTATFVGGTIVVATLIGHSAFGIRAHRNASRRGTGRQESGSSNTLPAGPRT